MREQTTNFDHYLQTRYAKADAITPGQKITVIQALRRETHEQGRVPLAGGPVRVDITNEAVRAALDGRTVSVDGQTVKAKPAVTSAEGLAALSPGKKIALIGGIFLLPLLLGLAVMLITGREDENADTAVTPTATEEAGNLITSSALSAGLGAIGLDQPEPAPTETPIPPTATPEIPPTIPPPQVIIVTPTPFPALQINERGRVAETGNDPASIEVAGFAYILTTGAVNNGLWQPRGAEWLQGTTLRRVIAVPYDEALLTALFALSAQEPIRLRLRSGEVVPYQLTEVARVGQMEIDILTAPTPSIAIVLYGEEAADTRWVVIGEAVQGKADFTEVSLPPVPAAQTAPPLVAVAGQEVTSEDLTLTVTACAESEEAAPGRHQRILTCELAIEATQETTATGEALIITERVWAESGAGWLPWQTVQFPDLPAGETASFTLTGVVNAATTEQADGSAPVLLWRRAGATYLIQLAVTE